MRLTRGHQRTYRHPDHATLGPADGACNASIPKHTKLADIIFCVFEFDKRACKIFSPALFAACWEFTSGDALFVARGTARRRAMVIAFATDSLSSDNMTWLQAAADAKCRHGRVKHPD